jgi:hypothetical protein
MMIDPTAMILSSSAQRRHLAGARLDGPVEPDRRAPRHRIRRSMASLLVRAGTALEPAPRRTGPAQQLRRAGA